ncbi:linear amide C-N hydrolase [Microbacterium rhizomatis]|uniref:Linear amide C-N hydrolase n=1 Tax=Microbacterium rhizomatis TaxID=1631477 RepID=A0A5J5J184_9MICO|nr:linear amide C-N hydrolase [Microbacterium rhizomatis]KAA9107744.1 linear amide C-N hydrolase [Microbacterium rhizomatis]
MSRDGVLVVRHENEIGSTMPRLTAANPAPVTVNGVEFAPLSQGQGFVGLPGDSGSAGRYLRATAYVMTLKPAADADNLEQLSLHALNNFDIPIGMMSGVSGTGLEQDDQTKWSSIASLTAGRYIVRTQANPTPMAVNLAATDFTGAAPRQVDLAPGAFQMITV